MNTEKQPIYPVEVWDITEQEFQKENNYRNETTFALSNGYIGTRGTFEEAIPLILIPDWKEILLMDFTRVNIYAMERQILVLLFLVSLF